MRRAPFRTSARLRLKSSVPLPDGWQLPRLTAEQRAERTRHTRRRAQIKAKIAALEGIDVEAVRLAIEDMEKQFPDRYDAAPHRQTLAQFERDAQPC